MASIPTVARLSFDHGLSTIQNAAASDSPRHSIRVLPLVAALFFSLHGAAALAGDIARDTPAASMALAQGLYAAPGPSAAVSTVATPTITASPLPSASPPVAVPAAAPSLAATAPLPPPPVKAPEAEWISYAAIVMGVVGAIAGIAGAIMGALALRRANRQARRF
jgi:hypothetical protein